MGKGLSVFNPCCTIRQSGVRTSSEILGTSRGSLRPPPVREGAAGRAPREELPRRRGPRADLHTRGSALPFSGARRGKKEILSLASGEVPPARQGGPFSAARVPSGNPAKGCVSPHPQPRTTRLRGSWSREKGLGPRGGMEGLRDGGRQPCPRRCDGADAALSYRGPFEEDKAVAAARR